jgi:YVTN family beta-propeller protein
MWRFLGGRAVVGTDASVPVVRSVVVALGLLLALLALASLAPAGRAEAAPALRAGGPDDFGYTFKDSNEPGGPSYAWEDIAATGTLATGWNSYNNGFAGPIPIGFNFEFYGVSYNQLYVGSNGYVSFGNGFGSVPAYSTLPHPSDPNNMIALFGGDLFLHNYGQDSAVHYQTLSNPTRLVVQFDRLYWCCSAFHEYTFQVVIFPHGDIEARYGQLGYASTYVVGIENANGTDGLDYGALPANGLAIRYSYPTGVMLAPPEQGSFGKLGSLARYSVRVTNHTGSPDSFELAVQPGSDWPTTLSISQTGTLADGASVLFDAWVTIPAGAAVGDIGQSTIEATSATSPTVQATAVLSTTASSDEIAYIVSSNGSLTLVDTTLRRVLDVVSLDAAGCQIPRRAAITPDGAQVYVSCYESDSVAVVDASNHTVIAHLTGIDSPQSLAFTRDGNYALVVDSSPYQITAINTQTYAFSHIALPWLATEIVVHPYLDRAYVIRYHPGYDDGAMLVIDTTTFTIMGTLDLPGSAWGLAISTDGRYVYASVPSQGGIAVVDAIHNTLNEVVQGTGSLNRMAVASAPKAIYASQDYAVRVIDEATLQSVAFIPLNGPIVPAATCNGLEVWVVTYYGSSAHIIDTAVNQVVGEVALPAWNQRDVAICPQPVQQGVFALPAEQSGAGALGATVLYEFTVVNATGAVDSFILSLGTSNWPTTLVTNTVGPLAPNEAATVQVAVTIPADAAWYESDRVEVTVRGVSDPNYVAAVHLTTTADAPPTIDVSPMALSSVQQVGQTIDQSLLVGNGNGVTLTVAISDFDLTPGRARSPQVEAGQVYSTTVDNEDNALTGSPDGDMDTTVCSSSAIAPVEFNILVDRVPAPTGNVLTIRAYNYYNHANASQVILNGVALGELPNNSHQWSETSFSIPSGVALPGVNLVQVIIRQDQCVEIDWGEMLVTGTPADWLQQTPSSASLPANSSQNIVVTFDSAGVQPGVHQAAVVLTSNDPAQPYLAVPVTMTVQPTADMGSVAGAITDAWTGQPLTATVELVGVHTLTGRTDYQIWAPAGAYELVVGASGYVTVTTPVVITAGGAAVQDVALEPALARLEWLPLAVQASVAPGGQTASTLMISNTGPLPLDLALFEIDLDFTESPPARENLIGKRILYDRSHGQQASSTHATLINDVVAAGAIVVENTTFPISANVLEGYDVLWSNCCGSISWGFSELIAVDHWMRRGGAVLVHGPNRPSTAGLATVRDVFYNSDYCSSSPANIAPHPITAGVSSLYYDFSACHLSAPPSFSPVVYGNDGRPSVVAEEANGGKMVVLSTNVFDEWSIRYSDNRLFGNNILRWLARPSYSDVSWLSLSPTSAVVPGHSSLPVTAAFDATNLSTGVYRARLALEHNDPNQEFPVEIPVTLTVEVPTALRLNEPLAAGQPAPLGALPLAALPAAAMVALGLAGWRRGWRNTTADGDGGWRNTTADGDS